MDSENTKTDKKTSGCGNFNQMPEMKSDMMKMMGNCFPGMMEQYKKGKNIPGMIAYCCGQIKNKEK